MRVSSKKTLAPTQRVYNLRMAIKPTSEEFDRRCVRDRAKPYLLQRELANRLGCEKQTICYCENKQIIPRVKALVNALERWEKKIFGEVQQ